MNLRFDAETHTYWHGEHRVPSVTQVLGAMTDLDEIRRLRPGVIEHASERGDAVHYGCELYDQGRLDWDTVGDEIRPYIEAWVKFRAETGFVPDAIEERVFHPVHKYAGTLDRRGTLHGVPSIVDIKCVAAMYPTTGLQTAAYAKAIEAAAPGTPQFARAAVQLLPTGQYKLHVYADRADWPTFLGMLNIIRWADKNKQRLLYEPA